MREYRAALKLRPGDVRALCGTALVHISRGLPDKVVESMTAVIAAEPRSAYAYGIAGAALHDSGLLDEALESYELAIAIDPGDVCARIRKAQALQGLGRPEESALAVRKCLGARLNEMSPREERRLRSIAAGAASGAPVLRSADSEIFIPGLRALLEAAFGPDPGPDPDPHSEISVEGALRTGEHYDACMELADEVLAEFPDSARTWCMKAMLLSDDDRVGEALACYDRAVEAEPGEALAYSNKADLLADAGDAEGAARCLREALRAAPSGGGSARMQDMRALLRMLEAGEPYPDSRSLGTAAATARWAAQKRSRAARRFPPGLLGDSPRRAGKPRRPG